MKAGKQLVPAFYLFLDSWCISSAITIWTFSSGSLPLPADLPQVPQCHLRIHSGHYSYSRNFLFFHPLLVFLTLTHSVRSSLPGLLSISPAFPRDIPSLSISWISQRPVRWGERVLLSPRDASKGIYFPLAQHDNFLLLREAFLDQLY